MDAGRVDVDVPLTWPQVGVLLVIGTNYLSQVLEYPEEGIDTIFRSRYVGGVPLLMGCRICFGTGSLILHMKGIHRLLTIASYKIENVDETLSLTS